MTKTYKLALLGFGNVNWALAQIIADDPGDKAKDWVLIFRLSLSRTCFSDLPMIQTGSI